MQTNMNGILDQRTLPDPEFLQLWERIIIDPETKGRLLSQAIVNYTLRAKVDRAIVPLHGIILLVGEPGTGKTSLAKGLAARTAEALTLRGKFQYIEVEPHGLVSSALGKSQRAVMEFLGSTVAELAATCPLIVLLDEVETLATDRSKLSLDANPVDVHRATDAVLAQLDQLALKYPDLLFIATSNFPKIIDGAFLSRADLVMTIGLPTPVACRAILVDTLDGIGAVFPKVSGLVQDPEFDRAVALCVGLDGRRIRKLVVAACTFDKKVAIDPNQLTMANLLRAIEHEQHQKYSTGENL